MSENTRALGPNTKTLPCFAFATLCACPFLIASVAFLIKCFWGNSASARLLVPVASAIDVMPLMPIAGIIGLVFIAKAWRGSRGYNKILLVLYVTVILFYAINLLRWISNDIRTVLFMVQINIYELVAAAGFLLAYLVLRLANRSYSNSISYLAVFSATSIVLNPYLIEMVFIREHLPFSMVGGNERFRSFLMGIVALITGIIALKRISRSHGELRGRPFAFVGIVGGTAWALYWIQLYLRFAAAMASW